MPRLHHQYLERQITLRGMVDEPGLEYRELYALLEELKVPHKLVVREGKAHGWPTLGQDVPILAEWIDEHVGKR